MPFRNINDPRDPWAFRETWTGEARTSYEELWIVVPLAVGLLLVAFLLLLPLLVHKWCRRRLARAFWRLFDKFLRVLHEIGKKKVLQEGSANSFDNPCLSSRPPPTTRELRRPGGRGTSCRSTCDLPSAT
ncbi:hypothetical protein M3Y99_00848100 [Aphelenchoides fujianensis]|nr:hypothetical protein M3Y99_00848100 [Aphelenchoides fujianensis]